MWGTRFVPYGWAVARMEPDARSRAEQTAAAAGQQSAVAGRGRADQPVAYAERLWVPVGWWLLGGLFALSLLVAVLFYLGPLFGIGAGLLVMAVITPVFVVYGRQQIRVTADRLWVGEANIEWRYIADIQVLDALATRRRRGPDADVRAFLVLRPYLTEAVEVTIRDEADPTPYWLVNSRHPARLAAAVRARLQTSRPGDPRSRNETTSGPDDSGPSVPGDTIQS